MDNKSKPQPTSKRDSTIADKYRAYVHLLKEKGLTVKAMAKETGIGYNKMTGILKKRKDVGTYVSNNVTQADLDKLTKAYAPLLDLTHEETLEGLEQRQQENEKIIRLLEDVLREQKSIQVDLYRQIARDLPDLIKKEFERQWAQLKYEIKKEIDSK